MLTVHHAGHDWQGDVPRFDCVAAESASPQLPKLLVRVEHELDGEVFAPAQEAFVAAAREHEARRRVLDVPGAHHPFEDRDHTEGTRTAVRDALDWVARSVSNSST